MTAVTIDNGSRVRILSNTTFSNLSMLQASGTANNMLGFGSTVATGTNRDYTLNRELGTIQLEESLEEGDLITSGNDFNRASIRTSVSIDNATRIDSQVEFTITVDEDIADDGTVSGGTEINITFDDRFSGDYLDSEVDASDPSTEADRFGFDKLSVTASIISLPDLIVEYLNDQLYPYATAFLREVGTEDFLEIRTNTISSRNVTTTEVDELRNGTIRFTLNNLAGPWSNIVSESDNVGDLIENERPHLAF